MNIVKIIENHYFEWIILVLMIVGLLYTMIVIKEEKNSYLESAIKKPFHDFIFNIPSWWGLAQETDTKLVYKRLDTHYDWEAVLEYFSQFPTQVSTEEETIKFLKSKKLEFDKDTTIIQTAETLSFDKTIFDAVRVEGTATKDEIERVYFDIFLLKNIQDNSYLVATSTSSVLNGVIEGPYFEEVLTNFSLEKNNVIS